MPGIVMPAHPQIGDQYRQEYANVIAADTGEVVSLTGSDTTPLTGTTGLLVIKDADLLDPTGPAENKYYAGKSTLSLYDSPSTTDHGRELCTSVDQTAVDLRPDAGMERSAVVRISLVLSWGR